MPLPYHMNDKSVSFALDLLGNGSASASDKGTHDRTTGGGGFAFAISELRCEG